MTRIGILSDTHDYLDQDLKGFFSDCDEIWHAGDVISIEILEELETWKPLRAVYGNACNAEVRQTYPLDNHFQIEGLNIWMTHIGGYPGRYHPRVRAILEDNPPHIFVCGHSHILKVLRDKRFGCLVVNPGAAGNHGFHKFRTAIRMELDAGKVAGLEVIELGTRGELAD
jgi:putative phosphoesterase